MSGEITLALPILPAVAEPIAEPLGPLQSVLDGVEAKGFDLSSVSLATATTLSQSTTLFSHEQAVAVVRRRLESHRFLLPRHKRQYNKKSRERRLTSQQEEAVQLRLQALKFREIAGKMGVSHESVRTLLKEAVPFLDEATVKKLHLKRGIILNFNELQTIVDLFFLELNRNPLPVRIISRMIKNLNMIHGTIYRRLNLAGVNYLGEIQRRRFDFILRVAATMEAPLYATQRELKVSVSTLTNYRRMVREGKHLNGPLELSTTPEGEEWWDLELPLIVGSEAAAGSSNARINLTVRNESVLKDLELFDQAIEEAKKLRHQLHPDSPHNHGKPDITQRFKQASERFQKLKRAKAKYVKRERAFREKYQLPMHVVLA